MPKCSRCKDRRPAPDRKKCQPCLEKVREPGRQRNKRRVHLLNLMKRHHISYSRARELSKIASNEFSRCGICGIPVWWLRLMLKYAYGSRESNKRLSIDHLEPGDATRLRVLCYSCNARRGHAEWTDERVLTFMRRWYRYRFGVQYLWWLNITPGIGGRADRNETCTRRNLVLAMGG